MIRNRPGNRRHAARRNHTLLERLVADDQQTPLNGEDEFSAKIESIRGSLIRLLNSRNGFSRSSALYGLGDFNDATVGSTDMMRVVAKDIENSITLNEPRVENVKVSFDRSRKSSTELMFQITATTRIKHRSEQVIMDLVLSGGRNFRLR